MNIYGSIVVLHLLGACVWVGWHLALSCSLLPQVWKSRDRYLWQKIETVYQTIAIPALIVQTASGLVLAYGYVPEMASWFDIRSSMGRLIGVKIVLLLLTLALGLDLRFRLLPKLELSGLKILKWPVALITVLSVIQVFVGVSFRIGWLY